MEISNETKKRVQEFSRENHTGIWWKDLAINLETMNEEEAIERSEHCLWQADIEFKLHTKEIMAWGYLTLYRRIEKYVRKTYILPANITTKIYKKGKHFETKYWRFYDEQKKIN